MIYQVFKLSRIFFKILFYLVFATEITNCTLSDLKQKAGHSVRGGLINLKHLNSSLHGD